MWIENYGFRENTTISRGKDVLGYFCFWALTWWVWASEVAFNVRFRQADAINRIAVVLQLAIFGALSAFTTDFDITAGIGNGSTREQQEAAQIQVQLNYSSVQGVQAHQFQTDRLPVLNFRGVSMVMGLSRLLLMTQYIIVFVYAFQYRPHRSLSSFWATSSSLLVHIISLLFSSTLFFAAFGVVGHNPSTHDNIVKVILWYTALISEVVAHFVPYIFHLAGHVPYSPAGLYARGSILFIVVLGQELDQLTGTFRYIVGPAGFDAASSGMLISTGVILVGQFTLFFGSPVLKKKSARGLAWFFGQWLYTIALIILLAGTVNQLISFNLGRTQEVIFNAVLDIEDRQIAIFPTRLEMDQAPINDTSSLDKSGIAVNDVIDGIYFARQGNDTGHKEARIAQFETEIVGIILKQFDLFPAADDPVYWQLALILDSTDPDPNVINKDKVYSVLSQFVRANLDSTTWFPAAAGMTLVLLGLLRFIRQTPRDKWEMLSFLNLTIGGLVYIPLCILDIGSKRQIETVDDTFTVHLNAAIWRFAASGWVLPSFAILTILVMIGDAVCDYMARRALRKQVGSYDPHIYAPMLEEKLHSQYPAPDRPSTSVETVLQRKMTMPVPHPAP